MHFNELGYDSYDEFLEGKEWAEMRNAYYALKVGYRCRICHSRMRIKVHKRSYVYLQLSFFKKRKRLFKKVMVYLCEKCNQKVHFYNKNDKVPLDYLTLWDREQELYWRIDNMLLRMIRTTWRITKRLFLSYRLGSRKRGLGIFFFV